MVALTGLAPAAALAHGSEEHAPLHVGNRYDECWVEFAPELTQEAFAQFAREFGSVSAFKPMAPPTTLGKGGVEVAIEQMTFTLEDRTARWNDTFYHPAADHELGSEQTFPKVRMRVGVANAVDVGAYYTRNPKANYGWLGLDLKYGMLRQSETMPVSVALRGAYTRTLYVDDMDMNTFSADAAVGRTFWNRLTPYAGVGSDLVLVREQSDKVDLEDEQQGAGRVFGGVELRLWHVALGAEGEAGALNRFDVKVSAIF
jgi:opacity protein-like surface antigen